MTTTHPFSAPAPTPVEAAANSQNSPAGGPRAVERLSWVPIRSLSARHRSRILKHLLALDDHDRYLRFGSIASDAQIAHYVDLIDFDSDEVFGIFNRRLDLLAVAHLAYAPTALAGQAVGMPTSKSAEFGVSVAAHARGRGYGARLFDRSVLRARNRGVERLVIHALTENTAMLKIARKAGATVVRDGSESQAELLLPHDHVGTHVEAFVEEAVAEIDFRIKAQAHAVGQLLTAISEVSAIVMPRDDVAPAATDDDQPASSASPGAPDAATHR